MLSEDFSGMNDVDSHSDCIAARVAALLAPATSRHLVYISMKKETKHSSTRMIS